MNISRKTVLFFSAFGGTERVARLIGDKIGVKDMYFNFTSESVYVEFQPEDLVVFAVPVYGGRIPSPVYERMEDLKGNNTPAVVVAVYGNRAVDDAGLEMSDLITSKGFRTIAYAEFVAPHSLAPQFGAGRPDVLDISIMDKFAAALLKKLEADEFSTVTPPGNRPYCKYTGTPLKPVVNHHCIQCGECVTFCPTGAVDPDEPRKIDGKKCIACTGCIERCLQEARSMPKPVMMSIGVFLKSVCSTRKIPKYIV